MGYGAFIMPDLLMLSILTQSLANASFAIYCPRFAGTIFELLSAPVSSFEIVLSYAGAAATKSLILALIILATSFLFVPLLSAVTFSLLGFIIGIWADSFEKLQLNPAADRHAADISRRQLLLNHHAAALLAESQPVQSGGLSHLLPALEFL